MPRAARLVALATLAGAIVRFATLGDQSLWLDEAATADLMDRSLGDMLRGVADGESTPPLFYLLSWMSAQVLGTGEAALRALPALLGTATIPLVALLARRVAGARAAVLAAALAAVCPLLVWYAQEARAYALLALLATASALLVLRAADRPAAGRLAAWAAVAILAIATHWFALFLVAGEAAWLLWAVRGGRGPAVAACAAVAAAAAALLPLLLSQRDAGRAGFIDEDALATRLAQIPKQFAIGYDAPAENLLAAAALALLLVAGAGLALGLRRGAGDRRAAGAVLAAAGAALALPLAAAAAGSDFVLTRNVLAALPLLIALAGAGFALLPAPRAGLAAAAALAALWLAAVVAVAATPRLQRDDWRGATRALGPAAGPRVVVVRPASGRVPAARYLGAGARPARAPLTIREIDVVTLDTSRGAGRGTPPPAAPPLPGFAPAGERTASTWRAQRFTAPVPVPVDPASLAGAGAVLVAP